MTWISDVILMDGWMEMCAELTPLIIRYIFYFKVPKNLEISCLDLFIKNDIINTSPMIGSFIKGQSTFWWNALILTSSLPSEWGPGYGQHWAPSRRLHWYHHGINLRHHHGALPDTITASILGTITAHYLIPSRPSILGTITALSLRRSRHQF